MKYKDIGKLPKSTTIKLLTILILVAALDLMAFKYYLDSEKVIHEKHVDSQVALSVDKSLLKTSDTHSEEPPKVGPAISVPKHSKVVSDNQNFAPVISNINTNEKVVFLTIDDGGTKHADMLELLQKNNVKASLFLTNNFIADNYDFFKPFKNSGMSIQNHTLSHQYARPGALSYQTQKNEICGMSDKIEKIYGARPTLFRPPGGWVDDNTKLATKECGMKAVVLWIAKANGRSMQYQVGKSLRPGDIVLMHFRPEFADDLAAFVRARDEAGLTTDYLENWI